jgi:heterodisulfide reductase subunit A2
MTMNDPVVIVGGGIAGLAVSAALSRNGVATSLVERNHALGGHVVNWACMATNRCMRCFCCSVEDLIEEVEDSPTVEVMLGWEFSTLTQSKGAIEKVTVSSGSDGSETELDASVLVFATGFQTYNPADKVFWGYGRFEGVLTLADVNARVRAEALESLEHGIDQPLKVAFFQCVGSRDVTIGANYCSQYCCQAALKTALKLREERPDWEITIYYIDLQIAGKMAGLLWEQAREKNIRLVQGVPGEVMQTADGMLEIIREEAGRNVRETFHRVVLSIGQSPGSDNPFLASTAGLKLDEFGFISTRDPLDSSRTTCPGIYLAGTSSGPMDIEGSLMHGYQTASAIIADLVGSGRS